MILKGVFIIFTMKPAPNQETRCPYCKVQIPSANLPIHKHRCLARAPQASKNPQRLKEEQKSTKEKKQAPIERKKQERPQEMEKFQCYLCGHMQMIAELDDHFKICPNREIPCPHCRENYPRNLLFEHQKYCEGLDQSDSSDSSSLFGSNSLGDSSDSYLDSYESEDEQAEGSDVGAASLPGGSRSERIDSIEERRDNILRRINQMCTERGRRHEFYQRLIMDLHELHAQIRRRASQAGGSQGGGMTKKQISQIPNKKYKFDGTNKETCSICYTDFANNEEIKNIECRHLFHVQCISQWLIRNKHCPNCKRVVVGAKISKKSKQVKGPSNVQAKKQQKRK